MAPPLFGALSVLVVGLLGARRLGPGTGLAAAVLLALLPAHIEVTVAGRFDYDMVEPLLLLLALRAYLALDGPGSPSRRRLALAAALFLVLLIWRRSTVLLGMIAAPAIAEAAAPRTRPAGAAAHSAGAFAWLALFLGLFCLLDPWGNQGGFRFNVLSWFHVFPVDVKKLKIYQRVPGLKPRLQGPPATPLRIEGTVVTNRGRRFAWRWSSRLDEGGDAHVSLPDAVRPHSQATGLDRGSRLATPHLRTELIVDEAELADSERRVHIAGR